MTHWELKKAFEKYQCLRSIDHRYASFDFCYNYFSDKKENAASTENMSQSCLHLGFYLSSWGMLRNSKLMQKSLWFYKPVVKAISDVYRDFSSIDVNQYSLDNRKKLLQIYSIIDASLNDVNINRVTLVTKILLGVFGNTPAFDTYFIKTFQKENFPITYKNFREAELKAVMMFYDEHKNQIEELRKQCKIYDFESGKSCKKFYTRAKIIDMIGFGHSFRS